MLEETEFRKSTNPHSRSMTEVRNSSILSKEWNAFHGRITVHGIAWAIENTDTPLPWFSTGWRWALASTITANRASNVGMNFPLVFPQLPLLSLLLLLLQVRQESSKLQRCSEFSLSVLILWRDKKEPLHAEEETEEGSGIPTQRIAAMLSLKSNSGAADGVSFTKCLKIPWGKQAEHRLNWQIKIIPL